MAKQTKSKQPATPPMPPERTHPIPLSHYHEAVQRHFEWAPSDYELLEHWPNGPAIIKNGDQVYRVDNAHDIEEQARLMLTSKDEAMNIPITWANELFEDAYMHPSFYTHFLHQLDLPRAQALAEVQLVLAVYQTVAAGPLTFWETVKDLDDIGLYPAALVAAAQTFDFDALVGELTEFLTTEGDTYLNEMQNGIFESVDLNENSETDEKIFYIYNLDPGYWRATQEG